MNRKWASEWRYALLLAAAWAAPAAALQTNVYYVDGTNGDGCAAPYMSWATAATNVQDAVEQAEAACDPGNGVFCEVVVADGVYVVTNQLVITKPIRLYSHSGDPATTALAGSYPAREHRVMNLAAEAWVSGFTISNGYAAGTGPTNYGGGVFMGTNALGRGGLLSDCRIVKNQAKRSPSGSQGRGCGVYLLAGVVSNCLIQGNTSDFGYGGGVFLAGGRLLDSRMLDNAVGTGVTTYGGGLYFYYGGFASNCLVAGNTARHSGGVHMDHGGEMVDSCISNNLAGNGKGAYLSCYGGTLRRCIVEYNTGGYTPGSGGGIYISRAGALVENCIVRYNAAGSIGGIYCDRSPVRNTLVYGNTATTGVAGGVRATAFDSTYLENTTIVRNKSTTSAGGLQILTASGRPYGGVMRNLIVMDNLAGTVSNNVALVPYSGYDIANNNAFVYSCTQPTIPGTGNTGGDPRFIDPGSGYGADAVAGDWRPRYHSSAAVNAGIYQTWMETARDLAGNPRMLPADGGVVDMGAYEAVPIPAGTIIRVR